MVFKTPTRYFLTVGSSEGFSTLNAFDGALLNAGIGNTNLMKMSSICPPHCKETPPFPLPQGSLVPVAYTVITSTTPGELIAAGVAIALPEDEDHASLIMEYSAAAPKAEVEAMVRRMAEEGMKMRGKAIREIKSIAVEHTAKKNGAALAAVVLWD
jgi:arginine decarboxylase